MIVLTPYEYYILKSALNAYRIEDDDAEGDYVSDTVHELQKKLFGCNSEGATDGSESVPPSIVIGPMAWAIDPDVHMQLCEKTTTYKRTSNERYRRKITVGI